MIAALTDDDPEAVAEAEAPGAEGIELRTGPVAGLDSGQVDTIDHLIPAEVIEHTTIEIVVKHIPEFVARGRTSRRRSVAAIERLGRRRRA